MSHLEHDTTVGAYALYISSALPFSLNINHWKCLLDVTTLYLANSILRKQYVSGC